MLRVPNHLLAVRVPWLTGGLLVVSALLMLLTIHLTIKEISDRQMQASAQEMTQIISGIRHYYAANVVERIQKAQGQAVLSERYQEIHGGIPIPATLSIELGAVVSKLGAAQGHTAYRFLSDYPFTSRQREPLDEFQREALDTLRKDPNTTLVSRLDSPWWGPSTYRLASPVKMTAVCVACHNSHPNSPKTNWEIGDVRGIQEVAVQSFQDIGFGALKYVLLYLVFVSAYSSVAIIVYRRQIAQVRKANAELSVAREREQEAKAKLQEKLDELKLLGAVVDGSTFGVTIADARQPDHPLVYANEAFYAMTGLDPSRVIGKNCRFLTGPQTDLAVSQRIGQAVLEGRRHVAEILNYRSNGSTFWNRLTLFPVGGQPGHPNHIVGYQTDITPAREAEVERQLMMGRIQDAVAAAEQASRTKSEFLALMSHELRTPMSGVMGMLGLALKEEMGAPVRSKVSVALQNARNLLTILNDLLDVAKIEAGKLDLECIDFSLRSIVHEAVMLLKDQADDKNTQIEVKFDERLPAYLRGDPTRVRQILVNLVGNAIKFTDNGTVTLEVRLVESVAADRDKAKRPVGLHVSVTDTGVGMSEETRSRLFQRFEQADRSTTRKYGGTGLGLAICKQLIELMGGWIDVSTTLGQGSCFFFEIGLQEGQEVAPEVPVDITPHQVSLKVLVAEDGLTNQMVIETILQEMGHQVTIVENGELALDALLHHAFDVILMDGRMPVMNGHEATQRIRGGTWRDRRIPQQSIPVIALTANASSVDRDAFIAAGADSFLTKPIDENQLHKALAGVIAKRSSGR